MQFELIHVDALRVILVGALIAVPIMIVMLAWQRSVKHAGIVFTIAFGMCLIGGSAGYLSGYSRVGVAGDVIPAALVFLGAGFAYIINLDNPRKAFLASMAVIAFISSFTTETIRGAERRGLYEIEASIDSLRIEEISDIRTHCLSLLLSNDFGQLPRLEKLRIRIWCKQYVPFLR